MKSQSRRNVIGALGGIGLAGLAPGKALGFVAQGLALPSSPMKLSRMIMRQLHDGEELTVSRAWRINFERHGQGASVSGEQLSVSVDAPALLQSIAEIEKKRSTAAMWPILLSDDGLIRASGPSVRASDVEAAVAAAEAALAQNPANSAQMPEHRIFLAQMQRAGSSVLQQLPADLFYPSIDPRKLTQSIELPGGMKGEIDIAYRAETYAQGDWLKQVSRKITTRIGDDERYSLDEWELSEL